MNGTVTTRHLLSEAATIIETFGLAVYCRCLYRCCFGRGEVTFLDCALRKQK